MSLRHLKKVRVVLSLLLFLPAAFIFLDLSGALPPWLVSGFASLQLIPSLVKLFATVGWGSLGLGVVLCLTFGFGRVYCSTICPLGTLQDIISRLNRRRNSQRRFLYRNQNYLLHYGLLFLALPLSLGGSMLLLNLVEPFSNFGRVTAVLVRPLAVVLNNLCSWILGSFHIYTVYTIPLRLLHPGVYAVPLIFLGTVAYMSYRSGRLFCNTLCPAGAILGLLSRVSFFQIIIDESTCEDCGLCGKVCKAGCIDVERKKVDFSACVSCFNCIDACPTVGLKYGGMHRRFSPPQKPHVNQRRRRLLKNTVSAAAAIVVLPGDSTKVALPAPAGKTRSKLPVAPPGSQSIEYFTSRCTACHLCVSACPTQVLMPSLFDYGIDGIFQPRMDYSVSTCTYDCTICGRVCPNGAILPLPLDDKKLVQIGKVKFVKDDCIVVTKKTDCGACAEHCPTKAVRMVKYEGGLMIPEVRDEFCIGCGACEHPCPTVPNKAIYVEANTVHQTAKKPETKKAQPDVVIDAGFPF